MWDMTVQNLVSDATMVCNVFDRIWWWSISSDALLFCIISALVSIMELYYDQQDCCSAIRWHVLLHSWWQIFYMNPHYEAGLNFFHIFTGYMYDMFHMQSAHLLSFVFFFLSFELSTDNDWFSKFSSKGTNLNIVLKVQLLLFLNPTLSF